MYMLRDTLFTYEVCHAADIRRPRMMLDRPDHGRILDLAQALGRDDANLRVITELVRTATGRMATGPLVHERFADLVSCGRLVLREVFPADVYPLTDPYAQAPTPIAPLVPDEPEAELSQAWISIELVHVGGSSTANVELELTTAKGREINGRIDTKGRWRADAIDRGSCTIRLFDHPVLNKQEPSPPQQISVEADDVVWLAGSNEPLNLRLNQHHRVVIVQHPEPYCPSA